MALSRNQRIPASAEEEAPPIGSATIVALSDDPALVPQIAKDGSLSIPTEDGGVVVDFAPKLPEAKEQEGHFANLAGKLDPGVLTTITEDVLRGVQADLDSRQEWEGMREEGIRMLGVSPRPPRSDVGNSTQPYEGYAAIDHPLLIESIARFQATAAAELYPPSGPVKVRDDRPSKPTWASGSNSQAMLAGLRQLMQQQQLAPEQMTSILAYLQEIPLPRDELSEALEKGFNHNLTVVDRGYRPDSVRMLFHVAFDGCAFKKVYDCPIRRRPVSRFVAAKDVIVSNAASHERDAGRITHRIRMDKAIMRRMEIAGVYRRTTDSTPTYQSDRIQEATARAQGLSESPPRQEDQPYTIYETYLDLDIQGYEHKEPGTGEPTGLPLPYKISIDRDNRVCKELRRNWEPEDETFQARHVLVKFGFIPALGFYDIGLLHLLGNGDRALTAAWRQAIDTAMFGNFPGFIYNEGVIRNWTNQNRVPPGGGIPIKGIGNLPLDQVIRPLPYKDLGAGLVNLIEHLEQRMDRVAGTGEIQVGEGRQDAPVGTTLALIEQATKVMAAVHVGLHASQADEFQLLKERYARNPESFWRWQKRKNAFPWEEALFLQALDDNEIVPAADPNTPSHMIRIMRAWAILQLAQVAPSLFKPVEAARRFFEMIGVPDPDEFLDEKAVPLGQQGPPPPDQARLAAIQQKGQQAAMEAQAKMAEIQAKSGQAAQEHAARLTELQADAAREERDRQLQGQQAVVESADRAADRASRERVAAMRIQQERDKLSAANTRHHLDVFAKPAVAAAAQAEPPQGLAVPP